MSTQRRTREKSSGTTLESLPNYDYELTPQGTHCWTHAETGLTIEARKRAGQRDGYGRIDMGFSALARDADGDVVAEICGSPAAAYLPSKSEAFAAIRAWAAEHPEGEL